MKLSQNVHKHRLSEDYTTVPALACKTAELSVPEASLTETMCNVNLARDEENKWTNHATKLLIKENLEKEDYISWAGFHASMQLQPTDPAALSVLLPLFYKKAATFAMVKHGLDIQKQITSYLNPGQTPVMAFDLPLFVLAKFV